MDASASWEQYVPDKITEPESNHQEITDKPQLRDILQKNWPFQKSQHQKAK